MPISVIVGGQFGSEGKGKVAHEFALRHSAAAVVRIGGSNSGHTVVNDKGQTFKFRHLPTAAVMPDVMCVIGPGSYIDVDVFLSEIDQVGISDKRIIVDPSAVIVSPEHKAAEQDLKSRIGSTASGTGAAVGARVMRQESLQFAKDHPVLNERFVMPSVAYLRELLQKRQRVIVEGTQGFGLSVLHSEHYPRVTSRDTSAASFVAECGLSPLDVDEVVLVVRSFPIRVSGDSGDLPDEIDWQTVSAESGSTEPIDERTTVTNNIRRVARFDPRVVRSAIDTNNPNIIVLNHVDHIDVECAVTCKVTRSAYEFIAGVEGDLDVQFDMFGFSPSETLDRRTFFGMSEIKTKIAEKRA